MGGYWGRRSGATDVHDPLRAKVLTFAAGEGKAALVALDLVGLGASSVQEIRRRVQAETGIPAAGVMVCCSHTHSGPLTLPFRGMGEVDVEYMARLQDTVVDLAGQAAAAMPEVRVAYARVPAQLGINRREARREGMVIGENPQGPVVPYAHVVRFDADEGLLATLFSHACHPVVLDNTNHSISADFAGAAARHVEARTRRPALFVNGACGDINPRQRGGFAEVEEVGRELGQAVVAGLDATEGVAGIPVRHASEKIELPLVEPPPRLQAETEKLALQLKAELSKLAGADVWAQRVTKARLAWAQEMLDLVRSGRNKDQAQPFEIQAIALGTLALLAMEGEIFVRYQLDLETRSPLQPTVVCGYANGCVGYVPTAEEHARGGYEVEEAYKVYPGVQMIGPKSEALIRKAAESMLEGLAGKGN